MDKADCAQRLNDFYLNGAIAAVLDRAVGKSVLGLTECLDCGIEIPEARRIAQKGCVRCVDCQTIAEKG